MSTLLSVPAGRSIRRPGTNWVDPQPEKGFIELSFQDDLMHLWWRDRNTGAKEDDLIIFPGEATFEKVQQDARGRTHILKFSSSDQKYFFWFQRRSADGDLRAQVDINELIQDPTYRPGSLPLPDRPSTPLRQEEAERSWPPTPGAPRLSHRQPNPVRPDRPESMRRRADGTENPELLQERMASLLVEYANRGLVPRQESGVHLTDVLSPANIRDLLANTPDLTNVIASHLPLDVHLPPNPTVDDLVPVLSAPQFTDAMVSLENALRSDGLPPSVMEEVGLPDGAGTDYASFIQALVNLGGGSSGAPGDSTSSRSGAGDPDENMGE